MGYYTWDNYALSIATKGNLTAWRNADVKLATGECITPDTWLSAFITQPHELTTKQGKPGKFIQGRYGSSMVDGFIMSNHRLQTVQFSYWMQQTPGAPTTENTPVGFNTHALTVPTTTTPIDFGIHFQSKLTSNDLLWDLLGLCPTRHTISCYEYDTTAKQSIEIPFAFLQSAGDDFTKTVRAEGTTGSITKTWDMAVDGGLGAAQTALTYNAGGDTECDIIGFNITENRNTWFGSRDGNGYATAGLMLGTEPIVQLEVIPTGDLLFDLIRVKRNAYAGDLDLNFSLIADATNDKITYDFDKLFMLNFDKNADYTQHPEAYTITLELMDENSSYTPTGIDILDNDDYENP